MRIWKPAAFLLASVLVFAVGNAFATDISGTIATTLTLMDNSRLVGDVTCTVTGAPCITIGTPGVTLDLNGFSVTGQGDPLTGFGGSVVGAETGILVNALNVANAAY